MTASLSLLEAQASSPSTQACHTAGVTTVARNVHRCNGLKVPLFTAGKDSRRRAPADLVRWMETARLEDGADHYGHQTPKRSRARARGLYEGFPVTRVTWSRRVRSVSLEDPGEFCSAVEKKGRPSRPPLFGACSSLLNLLVGVPKHCELFEVAKNSAKELVCASGAFRCGKSGGNAQRFCPRVAGASIAWPGSSTSSTRRARAKPSRAKPYSRHNGGMELTR